MQSEYIIRLNHIQYEMLSEVFDEALESENVSIKTKRDFASLRNDIKLQVKQPLRCLLLSPKQKVILASLLREKISWMHFKQSESPKIIPAVKKLFMDSEQHMSNLIKQLSNEGSIPTSKIQPGT
jgi:hypothetical protein